MKFDYVKNINCKFIEVLIITIVFNFAGCFLSFGSEKIEEQILNSDKVKITGFVEIPENKKADEFKIIAGETEGKIYADGKYEIYLTKDMTQIVMVKDNKDNIVYSSVQPVGNFNGTGEIIGAESTAKFMVFLTPYVVTSDREEGERFLERIGNLDTVAEMAEIIAESGGNMGWGDDKLLKLKNKAYMELIDNMKSESGIRRGYK